ncbi:hypothetical protein BC828DRAFT_377668 [Blastocladiella britannica]|nr:hypothetical protein BC828DRAFT_377668 [Blastocladiella britannica]
MSTTGPPAPAPAQEKKKTTTTHSKEENDSPFVAMMVQFASWMFPHYAPPPVEVVVLGDPDAAVLVLESLMEPLLGYTGSGSPFKQQQLARELTFRSAETLTYKVRVYRLYDGFMKRVVTGSLESANQIYYVLDPLRQKDTPLPATIAPYASRITFVTIHSLVKPEKVSRDTFPMTLVPAAASLVLLDGTDADAMQEAWNEHWRSAKDVASERRLEQLLASQAALRAKAAGPSSTPTPAPAPSPSPVEKKTDE